MPFVPYQSPSTEDMEHNCCRPFLLCILPSLLFHVQLPTWSSADEFWVTGPTDPIVAVLGGDATLPCSLSPAMNAEDMELRWFRSKFSEAVLVYQNGQELDEEQMPQYTGRTLLVRDFLFKGEAAVHIHNVQVSDNGMYTCFFKHGRHSEEAVLELQVAGLGSAPQVQIQSPEDDGVRVVCKASGWFPKPQVQWRDIHGEKLLEFSEVNTQDTAGLFSVEAALVVKDSSAGAVTCSILNPILGQGKVTAISIPEPFFPQAFPWKTAFAVSLTVLGLLLVGAGYVTMREHSAKVQEWQRQKDLEEALKANDALQEECDWRNAVNWDAGRMEQLYADWQDRGFQACPVILNPASAHARLAISPEQTSVTWKEIRKDKWNPCSVLGLKGITSGKCYWGVEIQGELAIRFALGVCRKNVTRRGYYDECPETGFWVVEWVHNRFCAHTGKGALQDIQQHPCMVGVLLDYSEGVVSFYNMIDGSHMFSFPPASFSGPLFPYFRLKSGDVTLSICSPVGGSEGFSVGPSNSLSLEETPRRVVQHRLWC